MLFFIDLTDTLEQRFVEGYLVLQVCQHRLHLLLNLTDLWRLLGLCQSKEHTAYTVEQTIALLKGQNGVLERSRILVLHDLCDVITSLLESSLKGGQIVGGLDLTEIRCSKGNFTLLQQGVLTLGLLAG